MNAYPAVLWPSHQHDLVMDVHTLLYVVQCMSGTYEDEPFDEPSQEQIDEWLLAGGDVI